MIYANIFLVIAALGFLFAIILLVILLFNESEWNQRDPEFLRKMQEHGEDDLA